MQEARPLPRQPASHIRHRLLSQRGMVRATTYRPLRHRPVAAAPTARGHPGGRLLGHA